jgi:3-oxoacyl-[acyl-carrier-protein] synthase II
VQPQLREELEFLNGLADRGIQPAVRGVTSVLGNTLETQFPVNVILASLAISRGAFFDPFDDSGVEQSFSGEPQQVLISSWGHWRGESLALVGKPDTPLRGQD